MDNGLQVRQKESHGKVAMTKVVSGVQSTIDINSHQPKNVWRVDQGLMVEIQTLCLQPWISAILKLKTPFMITCRIAPVMQARVNLQWHIVAHSDTAQGQSCYINIHCPTLQLK